VLAPTMTGFAVGQKVRVEDGPFWGRFALYDGQSSAERCFVLLHLMGRLVRAQVRESDLAAA
jgi:hypothetical protein